MSDIPKIFLTLPSGETRKYSLQMDSIRIGRAPDNTVVLEDGSLSAHHAVLHRRDDGFELVDLGSTNGIEFNGHRVLTHNLRHGDELKIGSVLMRFECPDMPALAAPPAIAESSDMEKEEFSPGPDASAPAQDDDPERNQRPSGAPEPKGGGCLSSIVLFCLTLLAPLLGMHVKHFQETGGKILLSDILQHTRTAQPSAPVPGADAEKPAADPAPAQP